MMYNQPPVGRLENRTLASPWAILLLVLAICPVTAPFASCDLDDLLTDRDSVNAILQSKGVHDKSVVCLTGGFVCGVHLTLAPELPLGSTTAALFRAVRQFPLRI
jgi:hypothetical protein